MRARDDWTHNRIIGQCSYPYDKAFIPQCEACQARKQRYGGMPPLHTFKQGECRWAAADHRTRDKKKKPHEPQEKASVEPTAVAPDKIEGKELGQEGEE